MPDVLRAESAPQLQATLHEVRPLVFNPVPTSPALPAHVRAGSAVRRWGQRLVVVQDDVHALALLDASAGVVAPLALTPGADGSYVFGEALGNKALKMDLEAAVVLPDGRLVALGSGSTARREHLVVVDERHHVRVVEGHELYAHLRARTDFAGSELNLEGAVVTSGSLRLLQRGNGAAIGGLVAVNALGDLPLDAFTAWLDGGPVPQLSAVWQVDLGRVAGVPFGFTDAAALPDGRIAFLAGAEDSPDTYRDGQVVGCRLGIIDGEDIRLTDIVEEDGALTRLKLEGIDWRGQGQDGSWHFVVVADMDAPDVPALMGSLTVTSGPSSDR